MRNPFWKDWRVQVVAGCLLILAGVLIGRFSPPSPSVLAQEIAHDTHGSVHLVRIEHHHGIAIADLQTPKGPEIAYFVGNRKYLAIGPLMDLKTGSNVTPLWEKKGAHHAT